MMRCPKCKKENYIMMAFVKKGALEAFQEAQANGYNYLHLEVTAFPVNLDDVKINISISG